MPTLNTKKANSLGGAKRKKVLDDSASRLNKKQKRHTPPSIKAGIRNAVTKVHTTISRSTTRRSGPATKRTKSTTRQIKRTSRTTKGRTPDRSDSKMTANRKVPVAKAGARVKAAARSSRAPLPRGKQSKSLSTTLTRPSEETKTRLAHGSASRRQLAKEKTTETGSKQKRSQYTKRTAKPRTLNARVKGVSST